MIAARVLTFAFAAVLACSQAMAGDCVTRSSFSHKHVQTGFVAATIGGVPGLLNLRDKSFLVVTPYSVPVQYPVQPLAAYSSTAFGYATQVYASRRQAAGDADNWRVESQADGASKWLASSTPSADVIKGRTIVQDTCASCHNPQKRAGGLSVYTGDGLGWERLDWSKLHSRVASDDPNRRMPPGKRLNDDAIGVFARLAEHGEAADAQRQQQSPCGQDACGEPANVAQQTPVESQIEGFAEALRTAIREAVIEGVREGCRQQPQSQPGRGSSGAQPAELPANGGLLVFVSRCAACHGPNQDGRPVLANADGQPIDLSAAQLVAVYGAAKFGYMPPLTDGSGNKLPPLTDDEFLALKEWLVARGLPE